VTNVDDAHGPIDNYKQNPISSAIAGTKQHLTDWRVEVRAFRREGTAFRKVGERFDTGACANAPLGRGSRSTVPNVTIDVPKIGLGLRRDHDAITDRSAQGSLSSSSNTSSTVCPSPLLAWARPRRILAITSRCSATCWYTIGSSTTASALPLIVSTSGRPVFFMCFIRSDELRLNVVNEWMSSATLTMHLYYILFASYSMLKKRGQRSVRKKLRELLAATVLCVN
jgi:hypothetical protein